MKFFFRQLINVVILLIFLTGCRESRTTINIPDGEMPDIGVPIEDVNRDLEIYSPRGYKNSFKNGESLSLNVKVLSDYSIQFPLDFGIKLFMYQNQQWVEIQNKFVYPPPSERVSHFIFPPSKNNILEEGFVDANPYQPDLEEAVPVRLIIVGEILRSGKVTNELSVGYFDFVLKP